MTMRQHLLPAWSHSLFTVAAQELGLRPGEWLDQSLLKYPHALISPVHWKAPFTFPNGSYIFGDSGGYSLRSPTMIVALDPVRVLRWQASTCTVGCVLDLPPNTGDKRNWERGIATTVKNARQSLPEYLRLRATGHPFRWWGVLHGDNEGEVERYYAALATVYPFDDEGEGWAIRAEPHVDIYTVARSLRVLKQLKVKRAHFLAATDQKVIAVLLALGPQAGLEVLTYDSASAIKAGLNRCMFRPNDDGLIFSVLKETGDGRQGRDYLLYDCECAVCAFMRARAEVSARRRQVAYDAKFGGWWGLWFQLHNLHIQQRLTAAQATMALEDSAHLLQTVLTADEQARVARIYNDESRRVVNRRQQTLLDFV